MTYFRKFINNLTSLDFVGCQSMRWLSFEWISTAALDSASKSSFLYSVDEEEVALSLLSDDEER